jgi:hypothetical protein
MHHTSRLPPPYIAIRVFGLATPPSHPIQYLGLPGELPRLLGRLAHAPPLVVAVRAPLLSLRVQRAQHVRLERGGGGGLVERALPVARVDAIAIAPGCGVEWKETGGPAESTRRENAQVLQGRAHMAQSANDANAKLECTKRACLQIIQKQQA